MRSWGHGDAFNLVPGPERPQLGTASGTQAMQVKRFCTGEGSLWESRVFLAHQLAHLSSLRQSCRRINEVARKRGVGLKENHCKSSGDGKEQRKSRGKGTHWFQCEFSLFGAGLMV